MGGRGISTRGLCGAPGGGGFGSGWLLPPSPLFAEDKEALIGKQGQFPSPSSTERTLL
jgi:hypothetical protein